MNNRKNLMRIMLLLICALAIAFNPTPAKAVDPACGNCFWDIYGNPWEQIDYCSNCAWYDVSCQCQYCTGGVAGSLCGGYNPCWPCDGYVCE